MNSLNWKPWVLTLITLFCILVPRSLSFLPLLPGVIGYFYILARTRKPLPLDKGLLFFFGLGAVLAGSSAFWAAYPDSAMNRTINTSGILLCGVLLLATIRAQIFKPALALNVLVAGYMLIGLYIFADYLSHMNLSSTILNKHVDVWNFNRALVTYVLLFIPMTILAAKIIENRISRILIITLMTLCVLLPLWKTTSQTAQVAFALSVGAFGLLNLIKGESPRKIIYVISGVVLAAAILTAPLIPAPLTQILSERAEQSDFSKSANTNGRLEIWNFVSGHIFEKPYLGHGVEATRHMKSDVELPVNRTYSMLHPHNAYLQIWVELGLVGAVLASAFALFVLRRISKADTDVQPLYFALYTSISAALAVGYGFWQSWQLGLIFALCAFCLLLTRLQKA